MNLFDKVVATISPDKAVKRIVARKRLDILNSGYGNHGASTTKKSLIGWNFHGGSTKEDIDDNLSVLRQRSRDLYMGGAPIATGAIKTLRTNVVGSGLKVKPQVDNELLNISYDDADKLERQIEREFALWSESVECDAERKNDFYELQQLVFLTRLLSGESFALLPFIKRKGSVYDIKVQVIEPDRCATPRGLLNTSNKIINGIEIGDYGEPVYYYFLNYHPLSNDIVINQKYTKISAFGKETGLPNVLHIMESERPEQRRGVPILAPVIESLKQLGRYTEAELMAAVVSGMYTIFIESEGTTMDDTSPAFGQAIPEGEEIDYDEYSYELGNGSVVALAPGDKAKEANPGRPNTAFDGFVTAICRQIGTALEIPYELLVKQFNSSYSASRASLLEAWKMFRMHREWLSNDFCQPVYETWLSEAVAKGRINAPGFFSDPLIKKAYCNAEWFGPSQGQIDPLKEVTAATKRVEEGFSTRQKETIELTGNDFIKNVRQRQKEEKLLKEIRGDDIYEKD